MSLASKVTVNAYYTRSINLERDANSTAVVGAYIPTSRAIKTLERIADSFESEQAPRAWSLVGPYGSGKSSFAVFLAHLLARADQDASKSAASVLRRANPKLARRFQSFGKGSLGHCYVLLTGSPEPLSSRLANALAESAASYWANRPGPAPKVVKDLAALASKVGITTTDILEGVEALQDAVAKVGGNGVLIVIDELGKFLEYEARHYGANDIFLLQALAEHAGAGHKANLTLVVLQHQSFEQYAKGLGESLKNEWAKVQGRFENIPFLESTEQILRVVAAAFSHQLSATDRAGIKATATKWANELAAAGALPSILDAKAAAELFTNCYPIHPVAAILLPILCQKVAQNERTLFSYLGSQEPHGFRDSLTRLEKVGDWIYPWEVYEYFILNQPAAVSDHYTHRRWAEVVTAVERLGDAPAIEGQLLKTIGLFNIVGPQGGFKASKTLVDLALPKKTEVKRATQALIPKALIQFRTFSGEYRVWQGSDFDLDAAVDEQRAKLGRLELAEALNRRHALLPIVARKYTIQSGTLRYFAPVFVDVKSFRTIGRCDEQPRIIFFLSEGKNDETIFTSDVVKAFDNLDLVVLHRNASLLREAVAENLALEAVQREAQELNADPVAQREFKDRHAAAQLAEQQLLTALTERPTYNIWYWQGEQLTITTKRQLQEALSHVLRSVFHCAPTVRNELINREKLSSQAAAARNKLFAAMIEAGDKADLGIEKFPPEKAIYRSLLRETRLHQEVEPGVWTFTAPTKRSPFYRTWKAIDEFLATTEREPRSFRELFDVLAAPPYGIKSGVLSILALAASLVYRDELAIYESRTYVPFLSPEHLERLTKTPDDFQVQRFRIEGVRASLFEQYSRALFNDGSRKTVIEIVRPLANFIGGLPDYAKKTKSAHISEDAKAVRTAFNLAKSPERLLFNDLPVALGYDVSTLDSCRNFDPEQFAARLRDALRELKNAFPKMLQVQQRLLAQAFQLDASTPLPDLRIKLAGRYAGLEELTVDVDGLRAFLKRLTKTSGTDEEWLQNLLMFLGQKPPEKWADADMSEAEVRLSDFASRILDLETLRLHYDKTRKKISGDFDVYLLKSLKRGGEAIEEVVAVDAKRHEAIQVVKRDLFASIDQYADSELQLAAVAEFLDEFLAGYRQRQRPKYEAANQGRKLKDASK
jgi:hypothetical protein